MLCCMKSHFSAVPYDLLCLQNAARDGFLDETIFRRANISLAMFAGTNLFLIGSTFISNPIYPTSPLLPSAAIALAAINANQLFVSGVNYVKYAPEGFNTLKILKVCTSSCYRQAFCDLAYRGTRF